MMTVLSIFGSIMLAVIVIALLLFLIVAFKLIVWFNLKPCKHCKHIMEYKGLKEDKDNGHYLFHCKHCGAWEQVPRKQLIRDCDKDCNPNT